MSNKTVSKRYDLSKKNNEIYDLYGTRKRERRKVIQGGKNNVFKRGNHKEFS